MTVFFVTGGARSGKSRFAEQLASQLTRESGAVCFVATGVAMDGEMADRIRRHRETRPTEWCTVEAPHDVDSVLHQGGYAVFLVDCLSLLLNNWMYDLACTERQFGERLDKLVQSLVQSEAHCIVVSNEIGLGLVPADAQSRRYRDWLGWMNQAVAQVATRVYFVASGIAVDLRQIPGVIAVDQQT